jgi:hypothetical protein
MELTEVSIGEAGEESGGDAIADEPAPREPAPPTAVCVYTGPVCVTIIDWPPSLPPASGVCRCAACHATYPADSASWFY